MDDKKRVYQEDVVPASIKPRHLVAGDNPTGAIPYSDGTNFSKVDIGGTGSLLTVSGGVPSWLAAGTNGYFLSLSAGLPVWDSVDRVISVLIFDDATDVIVGDGAGDVFIRIPALLNGWNLSGVAAKVGTAGTTNTTNIQIRNATDTTDMLSTLMTIDSGETDTSTAATPAVIDTTKDDVVTGDKIMFDVDATSTTEALGLLVEMTFTLP